MISKCLSVPTMLARLFGAGGLCCLALAWPAAAQSAATGSEFDAVRQLQQESATRNADLYAKIEELLSTIEDMKRLAFQIDLRIARIRHGDFRKDCAAATKEIADIDKTLSHLDEMAKEADALCASVAKDDTEALQICSQRRDDLGARRAELTDSRAVLVEACGPASPEGRK